MMMLLHSSTVCDVQFNQIEGNGRTFSHIELTKHQRHHIQCTWELLCSVEPVMPEYSSEVKTYGLSFLIVVAAVSSSLGAVQYTSKPQIFSIVLQELFLNSVGTFPQYLKVLFLNSVSTLPQFCRYFSSILQVPFLNSVGIFPLFCRYFSSILQVLFLNSVSTFLVFCRYFSSILYVLFLDYLGTFP